MKIETDNIIVSVDEEADVLRVTRKKISRATLNLDKDINTTIIVDLEQRAVAGLTITNFSITYPEIYKQLARQETVVRIIPQMEIALSKLTETLHLDQVIQKEAEKSPVAQLLKAALVGCR